ncbi:hypothetical protein PRZ48_010839 [Zasmidium cellare]|uniref:RapZ C-terminal domain-containing protein n=1 Tax=Zasmidium cellare TaxID=395010 RepID=A0ABR0E9S2_ZASCE|nr:hypothetical protein PRZ48_010839 [Zasmidium cellare]
MEEILQVGQGGASHEGVSKQASQPEETCFVAEASEDNPSDNQTRESDDEEAQAQYDSDQEEPNSSSGEIEPESDSRLLRISCFCERGRHRSVAFAEELGRMAWPRGWGVLVQHRDVDGQGGGRKRNGRSGRDGKRGGKRGLAFGFGSDGEEL